MTATGTRSKIMDAAEPLILDRGFAGTTVEAVVDEAGITKGTFFYHFDTKAELARALVERYAEMDLEHLERNMAEAEALTDDPLEQVLLFVRLFEGQMAELTEPYPGCLFASYCYQQQLFDDDVLAVAERTFLRWREEVGGKLEGALERHPPRTPVDPDDLADMLVVIFEGAYVLSRTLQEPRAVARQLRLYRRFLEGLFGVETPALPDV